MNRRVLLRALAGIVVSALALLLVAQTADIPSALGKIASVDLRLLALPAIAYVVQMWIRAKRWAIILSAVQPEPIGARQTLWPTTAGYLGNTVLPARLGEVVRIVLVARRTPVTATAATASVVIERVIDLLALLAFAAAAYGAVGTIGWLPLVGMVALLFVFGFLLRGASWFAARVPARLPARVRDVVVRLLESFAATGPSAVLRAWAVGLVAWLFDAAILFLCGRALGLEITPAAAVLISAGGALGAALPAAAAALGTYELGAVAVASLVGISPDAALQVALLGHVTTTVTLVVMGAVGIVVTSVAPGLRRPGEREPVPAAVSPEPDGAALAATAGER